MNQVLGLGLGLGSDFVFGRRICTSIRCHWTGVQPVDVVSQLPATVHRVCASTASKTRISPATQCLARSRSHECGRLCGTWSTLDNAQPKQHAEPNNTQTM